MYLKKKKKLCCIILSLFIMESPLKAAPNPYAHIFDESIYIQDSSISQHMHYSSIDDPQVQEVIVQSLIFRKVECLERRLFPVLDKELEDIRGLIAENKVSAGVTITKVLGTFFSTASSLALFAFAPGLAASRTAIEASAGVIGIGAGLTGVSEFLQPNGQVDLEKITRAIERQKKDLILKLTQEPFFDLEVQYLLKKRFYENPLLQQEMERTFIMSRIEDFPPLDFQREFLENCLKLPFRKKEIDLTIPWPNLRRDEELEQFDLHIDDLLRQNPSRRKLTSYEESVRRNLQSIIRQISAASVPGKKSDINAYYFYGHPGLGKSQAAKLIANYLGLPFLEMKIRTAEDISERSLEGANWKKEMGNPGKIMEALMTDIKTREAVTHRTLRIPTTFNSKYGLPPEMEVQVTISNQESFKNAVIVLNDFDRLVLDEDSSVEPLSFLLDYLDSQKETFFSPYCKASLKTENLIFFLTGNTPIPQTEKFRALRDRLVEVEFQPFEQRQKNEILSGFLNEQCIKYGLHLSQAEKDIILDAQTVSSIRRCRINIEIALSEMSVERQPIIHTVLAAPDAPEVILPLRRVNPEQIVSTPVLGKAFLSKVGTLEKVRSAALQLNESTQTLQLRGVSEILGGLSWGYVECLWRPTNFGKGASTNLAALKQTIDQFKTPDDKCTVLQFHLQLAQSITDTLIKKFRRGDYIYNEIMAPRTRDYRKKNLEKLFRHLILLGDITEANQILNVEEGEFKRRAQELIRTHRRWLGNNNLKLSQLRDLYDLETVLPTVVEDEI